MRLPYTFAICDPIFEEEPLSALTERSDFIKYIEDGTSRPPWSDDVIDFKTYAANSGLIEHLQRLRAFIESIGNLPPIW
jgi:hypothetical protein